MTGLLPRFLKLTRVSPIFKSGDSTNINNYGPIFAQFILRKTFEENVFLIRVTGSSTISIYLIILYLTSARICPLLMR